MLKRFFLASKTHSLLRKSHQGWVQWRNVEKHAIFMPYLQAVRCTLYSWVLCGTKRMTSACHRPLEKTSTGQSVLYGRSYLYTLRLRILLLLIRRYLNIFLMQWCIRFFSPFCTSSLFIGMVFIEFYFCLSKFYFVG